MGDAEDDAEIERLRAELEKVDREHAERRAPIVEAIKRAQSRKRVRKARTRD